jgi:hypothetical protein
MVLRIGLNERFLLSRILAQRRTLRSRSTVPRQGNHYHSSSVHKAKTAEQENYNRVNALAFARSSPGGLPIRAISRCSAL